jgi:hypothetical protein
MTILGAVIAREGVFLAADSLMFDEDGYFAKLSGGTPWGSRGPTSSP